MFHGQRIFRVSPQDSARLLTLFGLSLCMNQSGPFTRGDSNPSYYYPPHGFPCYATVRLCWTSFNGIEPTHQSPSMVIDHNHALTPIQCDVLMHMQCNAPLHVISCHIYNECYMHNSNYTIHHVLWTIISKAYHFQNKTHLNVNIY